MSKLVEIGSPQFKAAVKAEVQETLAGMLGSAIASKASPSNREWYPTSEAWKLLGFTSARMLREWRIKNQGRLRIGKHYRATDPNANRLNYEFHIKNCNRFRDGG